MAFFLCLVGVSGSGKTTYAYWRRQASEEPIVILSSDSIREELYGDESIQDNPKMVFSIMLARTKNYLAAGTSVIYDATNLSDRRRINLLNELKNYKCKKLCHILIAPLEICVENQKLRDRHVSEDVIKRQISQFRPPHLSEGWDEITMDIYNPINIDEEIDKLNNLARNFDQHNPYHSYNLLSHLERTTNYATLRNMELDIVIAANWHDIGKLFTQTFDEKGVAHYYGHENVSAYCYLLYAADAILINKVKNYFDLNVAFLIAHHMDFYKTDSYLQKVRARVGEDLYKKLLDLNECDKCAH